MRDMLSTAVGLFMIAAMTVIILLFVIPSPINYIILAVLLLFFAIFSGYLIINKLNTLLERVLQNENELNRLNHQIEEISKALKFPHSEYNGTDSDINRKTEIQK